MIRIWWIRIRIQETKKHTNPTDPDPQHCLKRICLFVRVWWSSEDEPHLLLLDWGRRPGDLQAPDLPPILLCLPDEARDKHMWQTHVTNTYDKHLYKHKITKKVPNTHVTKLANTGDNHMWQTHMANIHVSNTTDKHMLKHTWPGTLGNKRQ